MSNEQEVVAKWYNAVEVSVEFAELELSGKNGELVHRLRLKTDIGDVTFKPRKKAEVTGELAGFKTKTSTTELYTVSDFLLDFPVFKALSDNCSNGPQTVTLSYAEISGEDGTIYKFMRDSQAKTLYYSEFHKDTKETLDRQLEKKEKFKKGSL